MSTTAATDGPAGTNLAKAGYDAYGEAADWKNYAGDPMPRWPDLPAHIQAKWGVAAKAILLAAAPTEPDRAIRALNSMLSADREAVSALVGQRVSCTEALADHPTCQVGGGDEGPWQLGLLGVLNGICGCGPTGLAHICAEVEIDGRVTRFMRNEEP